MALAAVIFGGIGLSMSGAFDRVIEPTTISSGTGAGDAATPTLFYSGESTDAALRATFDSTYGTFTPVSWEGENDQTVQLPEGFRNGVIIYRGDRGYARWVAQGADGQRIKSGWGLSDDGTSDVITTEGKQATTLQIESKGPWTIELWPLSILPALPASGSPTDVIYGTECYLHDGPAGQVEITYEGDAYATIAQLTPTDENRILDIQGDVTARRAFEGGPTVVCVRVSRGTWSITTP